MVAIHLSYTENEGPSLKTLQANKCRSRQLNSGAVTSVKYRNDKNYLLVRGSTRRRYVAVWLLLIDRSREGADVHGVVGRLEYGAVVPDIGRTVDIVVHSTSGRHGHAT